MNGFETDSQKLNWPPPAKNIQDLQLQPKFSLSQHRRGVGTGAHSRLNAPEGDTGSSKLSAMRLFLHSAPTAMQSIGFLRRDIPWKKHVSVLKLNEHSCGGDREAEVNLCH